MDTQNKRIVICCDGTWNTPEKPTNVVKVVRSIKPIGADGKHQVVFYDQGVGTYNVVDKVIGGAFGKGVEQNVLDAYRFIVHNYQSGDEIYCFGFSRGAYTARALGGMMHAIGLLPKEELESLPTAYKYYRTAPQKRDQQTYSHNVKPDIKLMAVWDTVGSLGAPTPILGRLTRSLVGFFDTLLSPEIKNAYHALAIDEKRSPFQPALWTGEINSDQCVEQAWFAGAHSDVGGGYKESGLADIALTWMVHKSRLLGLDFSDDYLNNSDKVHPDVTGELHDSYSLPYRLMEKMGAKSGVRQLQGELNNSPIHVTVHESVIQRMQQLEDYRPVNFIDTLPVSRTDEKRRFSRSKTNHLRGAVQIDKESVDCEILDYSALGGVQVHCSKALKKSDTIAISSPRFAKTLATCVWQKGNTYGLKFAA